MRPRPISTNITIVSTGVVDSGTVRCVMEDSGAEGRRKPCPRSFSDLFSLTFLNGQYDDCFEDLFTSKSSRIKKQHKPVEAPYSGQRIRLLNRHGYHNWGVVEVYRAGTWGHVCDDRWDLQDATVACRQLGFLRGAKSASANTSLSLSERASGIILMDEVRCLGTEPALQQCRYISNHDCSLTEAATLECEESQDCPDGWTAGFGKCYKLFSKARNLRLAAAVCAMHNSTLVNVMSKRENHYLSNLLTNFAPEFHQWHTGGHIRKGKWYWYSLVERKQRARRRLNKNWRRQSRFKTVRLPVTEEMWFPGWPSYENRYAEPGNNNRKQCLTLSRQYTDPNGGHKVVDYFFWKADWCQKQSGINFICQIDIAGKADKATDCYTGDGASYRGETAVTQLGTTCLSWAASTRVNEFTHPGAGLGDHNFCRNPDDDSKPWCWVDHDRWSFGYCRIPQCSSQPEIPTTVPATEDVQECPAREFFCSRQRKCIAESFRCDNEEDCSSGEDEQGCDYALSQFSAIANSGLFHTTGVADVPNLDGDTVTWIESTDERCAKRCLSTTRFTCRSFVYTTSNRTCLLTSFNSRHGSLFSAPGSKFFELDSHRNKITCFLFVRVCRVFLF
ncbi:neurotrypsin [Plakobranchus ocellatus]|uniref:Neurotrypsin n=1 Tax=Plakobranchus ocellatus TaxID=259542 RepID=A0AAV4A0J9_9GAST|nr:neurotrypsin [Plakobranchus ocellatus]